RLQLTTGTFQDGPVQQRPPLLHQQDLPGMQQRYRDDDRWLLYVLDLLSRSGRVRPEHGRIHREILRPVTEFLLHNRISRAVSHEISKSRTRPWAISQLPVVSSYCGASVPRLVGGNTLTYTRSRSTMIARQIG